MEKNFKILLGILIVAALVIVGYSLAQHKKILSGVESTTEWENGIWNPETKQCEPAPESSGFFQCCFNYNLQQVDCKNSQRLLGPSALAIYQGTPGIGSVSQGIKITNTGNINITAFLQSFTWTASGGANKTFLDTAWASIQNVQKSITTGTFQSWSTPLIDIQTNCPATATTFSVSLITNATTTIGGVLYSQTATKSGSFTCTKETISYTVDFSGGIT